MHGLDAVSRCATKRSRRDSNPQVLADAGFRDASPLSRNPPQGHETPARHGIAAGDRFLVLPRNRRDPSTPGDNPGDTPTPVDLLEEG